MHIPIPRMHIPIPALTAYRLNCLPFLRYHFIIEKSFLQWQELKKWVLLYFFNLLYMSFILSCKLFFSYDLHILMSSQLLPKYFSHSKSSSQTHLPYTDLLL